VAGEGEGVDLVIEQSRRGFITGLISLVAAPAIVRAGSLMPVKAMDIERLPDFFLNGTPIYADLVDVTRKAFVPRLFIQLQVYEENPFLQALRYGGIK
jgi:hypothetical protein